MYSLIDRCLDKTMIFSFDKSGFRRHSKYFKSEDLKTSMQDKVVLITGANSGLGFEAALGLSRLRAKVYLLCRDAAKGEETIRILRNNFSDARSTLITIDVSDLNSIRKFVAEFKEERVDVLINNAGILPATRSTTPDGMEATLATNLVGPYLLTELLMERLKKSNDPRVINVSSGGMYMQKLDLENIQSMKQPFDGVIAYANTKRAQVILTETMASVHKDISFYSMHPGWADTPGVSKSLPKFWKLMKKRLRSAKEGADTIVWLAANKEIKNKSGLFWFDREPVSTHLFPWTKEKKQDQEKLLKLVREFSKA